MTSLSIVRPPATMKIDLPGYVPETLPSGATRHRVRVEGDKKRRITVPVGPSDPEFMEFYYAARAGKSPADLKEERQESDLPKETLDWFVAKYLARLEVEVSAGTKSILTLTQRRNILKRCCDFPDENEDGRMGALHYDIGQAGIVHIMECFGAATSQSDNAKKAFSAMYKWAKPKGLMKSNPAAGIDNMHVNQGGAIPWSAGDVHTFIRRWPIGTTPYLWLMLALCTDLRRSDAVWLGPKQETQIEGRKWLDWQPKKKGSKRVALPMLPPLLDAIEALPVRSTEAYILSKHGRPFKNAAVMGNAVRDWCLEAGLTNRSQHGVRKAFAELLGEVGCSNLQIMSVMSHTKPQTSAIYTEHAERKTMAGMAIDAVAPALNSLLVSHDV